jgi:hypothetical protein
MLANIWKAEADRLTVEVAQLRTLCLNEANHDLETNSKVEG